MFLIQGFCVDTMLLIRRFLWANWSLQGNFQKDKFDNKWLSERTVEQVFSCLFVSLGEVYLFYWLLLSLLVSPIYLFIYLFLFEDLCEYDSNMRKVLSRLAAGRYIPTPVRVWFCPRRPMWQVWMWSLLIQQSWTIPGAR